MLRDDPRGERGARSLACRFGVRLDLVEEESRPHVERVELEGRPRRERREEARSLEDRGRVVDRDAREDRERSPPGRGVHVHALDGERAHGPQL